MLSLTAYLVLITLNVLPATMPGLNALSSSVPDQPRAREPAKGSMQRQGFAGDDACKSCHSDQSLTFRRTAHHLTSQLPSAGSILGSFRNGSNLLRISPSLSPDGNPGVTYRMERKESGYYETAITEMGGRTETRSERIGVVIGSGVRGQSYLYWHDDELYELPVSYWSEGNQWINSPGFGDRAPIFDRPASPRCLECHMTYIEPLSPDPADNRYDRESLESGISCEVCHGPGARHIALRRRSSDTSLGEEDILNPAHFTRDRQVDMCALCHNGAQQTRGGEAFSYTPGHALNEYLGSNPADTTTRPDVHANQVGLLKRSRCYLGSANMTCSTCHDVHAPERTAASYSERCLSCHRTESCGMEKKLRPTIAGNCIGCHMPLLRTDAIVSETAGKTIRTSMRTHWIKVYSEAERQ